MKLVSIFLVLIALGLILGQTSSQAQINGSRETPAAAVKSAGNSGVTAMNLIGSSFAAFQSPAFQKDKIIKGRKFNLTTIDENTSRDEIPGQPTSLTSWKDRGGSIRDNVTPDSNYSQQQGISSLKSSKNWSGNPNIVYL